MSDTKTFQVGNVQVRVRSMPTLRGQHERWLDTGTTIQATSRTEADGYVWWKHGNSWSAEKTTDGAEVYLFEVAASGKADAVETIIFRIDTQVRVRSAAGLSGTHVRWLDADGQLVVEKNSRTEADGYVWWKHSAGWSAEKKADGSDIFLTKVELPKAKEDKGASAIVKEAAQETAAEQDNSTDDDTTTTSTTTKTDTSKVAGVSVSKKAFTADTQVRIRAGASLSAAHVGWLDSGTTIEVDGDSRTEANGYVWWEHAAGWSAEKKANGSDVYLVDPKDFIDKSKGTAKDMTVAGDYPNYRDDINANALPELDTLFTRVPYDLGSLGFWQYFGNNHFQQKIWSQGQKRDQFSQSMHAGLDFGVKQNGRVTVYAGVTGTFNKHITNYYKPNGLWVKTGDYIIIYGHIDEPRSFKPGDPITPDTPMGDIVFGGWSSGAPNHLHLEVRYKGVYLINPLILMSEATRNTIMNRFKPYSQYFYSDATWDKWLTPLDQPILKINDPVIGPNGR